MKYFLLLFGVLMFFDCNGVSKNNSAAPINRSALAVTPNSNNSIKKPTMNDKNLPDKNLTSKNIVGDLEYEVSLTPNGDSIVIRYTIKNKGAKSYLLFNHGDTNKGLGRGTVYVESTSGAIELSQKRFPEPRDKQCPNREVAVEAGAIWLKPGNIVTEEVRANQLLKLYTPFDDCTPQPAMPNEAKTVKFCLGVAEADPKSVQVGNGGFIKGWSGVREQQLLCSETVNLK